MEERKHLLASTTYSDMVAAEQGEKDKDSDTNIVISVRRMEDLFAAVSVSSDTCGTTCHDIDVEPRRADGDVSVICEFCGSVLYSDPAARIGKYHENTLTMVHNSITTGGMYTGYCNAAVAVKTKPVHEKAFYEIKDFLGEKSQLIGEQQWQRLYS